MMCHWGGGRHGDPPDFHCCQSWAAHPTEEFFICPLLHFLGMAVARHLPFPAAGPSFLSVILPRLPCGLFSQPLTYCPSRSVWTHCFPSLPAFLPMTVWSRTHVHLNTVASLTHQLVFWSCREAESSATFWDSSTWNNKDIPKQGFKKWSRF